MNAKPWWQSRTLWFNAIGLTLMTVQALSGANVIPPEYAVPALAVGNAVLRFVTTQPIGAKSESW